MGGHCGSPIFYVASCKKNVFFLLFSPFCPPDNRSNLGYPGHLGSHCRLPLQKPSKIAQKKCFCKVLKISTCLKKFKKVLKKLLDLFAGSEICTTFALAFGKQRGNAP